MRSRDVLSAGEDLPEHETVRLLVAATGRTRSDVLLGFDVSSEDRDKFWSYLERRRDGEPLQYIEGAVPFGSVEIQVDDRVLVPRPETEYLFELVTALAEDPAVIVDLCTGSGNLALALAAFFVDAEVFAVDLSPEAAIVARGNAKSNDLDIHVLVGDLFDPLPDSLRGRVDLLVSNPPYLAAGEVAGLPADVSAEPEMALVAGPKGDEMLSRIARQAEDWLVPGGLIACEISEFHGDRIAEIFERYDARIRQDLTGRDRYVIGTSRFG
ncbi:MAG: peptide chain release factor N(5)-glutamine methyltransferase [Actinobacteria bacterium]|nr:MAG: peptide chain release factor N(5)-glutamine methyltransferase [Actinomycetota bacterium]